MTSTSTSVKNPNPIVEIRGKALHKLLQEGVMCECFVLYGDDVPSYFPCLACKKIQDVLIQLNEYGYVQPPIEIESDN